MKPIPGQVYVGPEHFQVKSFLVLNKTDVFILHSLDQEISWRKTGYQKKSLLIFGGVVGTGYKLLTKKPKSK